jgi:ankyrin repeat protein
MAVNPERVFTDPKVIKLAQAVARGDLAATEEAIRAGADVKTVGVKGFTVVHFALYSRSVPVLKALLKAGADPISRLEVNESRGEQGNTVPHYAVSQDDADPDFVAVLLDAGVSPDLEQKEGWNPLLFEACLGRNLRVIKLLAERGANMNYTDPFTGTALHLAMGHVNFKMAKLLADLGTDPRIRNQQSPKITNPRSVKRTPAEWFCAVGNHDLRITPELLQDFEEVKKSFAKYGVEIPCELNDK